MFVFRILRQLIIGKPDQTREALCTTLRSFGVEVRLAERRRREEKIGTRRGRWISQPFSLTWVSRGDSLGMIEVEAGPIRWVNVLQYQWDDSPTDHWYVYVVPETRMHPGFPKFCIKLAAERKSWLGETIGVKWKGEDQSLGIIERLSKPSIIDVVFDLYRQGIATDMEIDADPDRGCWTVTGRAVPTRDLWDCYQAIAGELLRIPFAVE